MGDAVSVELALVVVDGVVGGVFDDEPVPVELGVGVAVPVPVAVPDALRLDDIDGVAAPLGDRDGLEPTDNDGVGVALGVELLLIVVDGVAGGVCVAEPVPEELGVGVAVAVPVEAPDALTVGDTDGVTALLGVCEGLAPTDSDGVGDADLDEVAVGDGVAVRLLVELAVLVTLPVPLLELVGVSVRAADTVVVAVTLPMPLLEGVFTDFLGVFQQLPFVFAHSAHIAVT